MRERTMSWTFALIRVLPALLLAVSAGPAFAQAQDPAAMVAWEKALREAGQDKPAEPPPAKAPPGQASPVQPRGNLNDQQDAAPRPNNLTVDPKYRGFIPVPNTPVMIKFNAKPRVDMTMDNRN